MRPEELSVKELEEREKVLRGQIQQQEIDVAKLYLDKIILVVTELNDEQGSAVYREPANFWERYKRMRARTTSDRDFLMLKEFPFYGDWCIGTNHGKNIDVGYCRQLYYDSRSSRGYEHAPEYAKERFMIAVEKSLHTRDIKLYVERINYLHPNVAPHLKQDVSVISINVESTWIQELDELYLIAFNKRRDSCIADVKKLEDKTTLLNEVLNKI